VLLRRWLFVCLPALIVLAVVNPAFAGYGFQPVSPEELKMTSEPQAPGAPAIILYRQVDRDDFGRTAHGGAILIGSEQQDAGRYEDNYFRIKIFTEDGRRFANVEIPLSSQVGSIGVVNGRTIRPDGTIVNFDGKIFEKTFYKGKGIQYNAKTFILPDVQPGCIIEYYYTILFRSGYFYNSYWELSNELFTRRAKFSLKPEQNDYAPVSFRWTEHVAPSTAHVQQGVDGIVHLDATNIAAFQSEDFMPPASELKEHVDFVYSHEPFELDPTKFWKKVGKKRNEYVEAFIGRRGAMEQAVGQIVSPSDSPEVKLQKIYARVQQLQNTSFEPHKAAQEAARNRKADENVEDVWKRGYGDSTQIAWLFLALARAAGIDASPVLLSDRRNYFFNPQSMDSGKLDAAVVVAKLNGKDVFLDPGVPFAPFGLLSWEKAGVQALKLDKDGGSFVQTTLPESATSHIERKADLKLSEAGELEGKITVTYTGLEGLRRRLDAYNDDDVAKKKRLEDEVKQYFPIGNDLELTNKPEWTNSAAPLISEFHLKVPGWATVAGHRVLVPIGLFGGEQKHLFVSGNRAHPIYFEFLSQDLDDVNIQLPSGWQVTSMPKAQNQDLHVVGYSVAAENNKGTLHLTRKLDINIVLLETKYYSPLRSFFQIVRTGDEQQIVLQPSASAMVN
jgi:hypothetical protein